ncbi:MAG: agmatinase [Candidatus Marinimicrobia bacterium]|nr:agmatinase [Candidatus Neomarinimicrobiota bacterium]
MTNKKQNHYPGAFGNLEQPYCSYNTAKIAILPIPYDGTSTWIKGADRGPAALIEASGNMEMYDIETDSEVYRRGIVTLEPLDCSAEPDEMAEQVYHTARRILNDDKFLVGLGGEHSVSSGLVRTTVERFENVSVLQLDAHSDLRDEYEDGPYNHACVMARIKELCPIVQVGIRSMDVSEKKNMDLNRALFAHEWFDHPDPIEWINSRLTDNVYLTIDLDVFDPAIMPSTGTPEPGGLWWYDVIKIIHGVAAQKTIVGMDVVELCPDPSNKAPDFMAAKLIYRTLSMIFTKEK